MRTAALVLVSWCALPAIGATLTFEEALARAKAARTVQELPHEALRTLESPQRFEWPTVRAEGALSNARNIDVFNENVVHNQVFSAVVSIDYPLLDGGAGAIRRRAGALDAASFRQRMHELEDDVLRETIDVVARLYTAQERRKILQLGLERAMDLRQRADELLDVREISNVTAAQWQDEAIVAESELIALELQHLDAEASLKQLIGDTSREAMEIVLSVDDLGTFSKRRPKATSACCAPRPSYRIASCRTKKREARDGRR